MSLTFHKTTKGATKFARSDDLICLKQLRIDMDVPMSSLPMDGLEIARLLHAGTLFKAQGVQILFDPILENPFSVNCSAFPSVSFDIELFKTQKFDAVFISHIHDDHFSIESLLWLPRQTPIYIYGPEGPLKALFKEMGFETVEILVIHQAVFVGPFCVVPQKALNPEVDAVFEIHALGLKILNMVDAWMAPETEALLAQQSPWDLVLWPFQLMREVEVLCPRFSDRERDPWPQEWSRQLQSLSPRGVVPSACQFIHEPWSWYRFAYFSYSYQEWADYVKTVLPETENVRLDPGDRLWISEKNLKRLGVLPWVHRESSLNDDYIFDPHFVVPSVAEIAKQFPAVTAEGWQKIKHACEIEFPQRYFEIGPPSDSFFQKNRVWKLSILSADGTRLDYFYRIVDESMDLCGAAEPQWITEICGVKLLGALEHGETLTSLYLQIHSPPLSASIENELALVDPLEDPLIRCLYEGRILDYQWAQWRRINHCVKGGLSNVPRLLSAQTFKVRSR